MQGQSVELLLEYIHMDDYGGDANGLKHAVDNVLLKQYNIPENILKTLMVYCCASTLKFSWIVKKYVKVYMWTIPFIVL